jgi:LPS export ABC transporter permease LptG
MIKRLDLYLISRFLLALMVVTVATGATIIVINMVEELRDFIDNQVPILSILEYYLYFGGWVVKSFLPMFIMLSALFSVTSLARKAEILAMKASGISLWRIALPLLITTLILAAGHFYYSEYIFPAANQKRLEIKEFTIEKRSRHKFTRVRDLNRQIEPGYFFTISSFNVARREGADFRLYRTSNRQLSRVVIAKKLIFDEYLWKAIDGTSRDFDEMGNTAFNHFDTLIVPDIVESPDDFAQRMGKPEDMGLDELKRYIELMKRTGGPYLHESVDLKMKYAYPVSSVIILFICIPFAANPRRGSIAVAIATGASIALVYFVLLRISQSAGYNAKIPEYVAAWGINAMFFVIGLISMWRAPK